ncbi:MAG: hypothetical protein ACXAEX_06110 [Promethearchaeota archaeon]
MELVKSVSSIEIPTDKISYEKKSNVLSAEVLNFMFVGIYKKSTRISKILDDIYASLGEIQMNRSDLSFIDPVLGSKIPETTKLKHLKISKKQKVEKEKKAVADKRKPVKRAKEEAYELKEEAFDEDEISFSSIADDVEFEEKKYEEEPMKDIYYMRDEKQEMIREKEAVKAKKKSRAMPPAPGAGPPAPKPAMAPSPPPADTLAGPPSPEATTVRTEPTKSLPEEPQLTIYNINMGLQYYSVMMEKRSYLFYVYFSHKELKIVDEEGKTIYQTTITIVTKKEEPPVLDLKIEGEGFEVHPIFGKVEVKKEAVNPPVMIFSIMPTKSKLKKMKKKESERRFLNVYIEFEEKVISHTILSIIVQPKYFRLDIGPIHLNLSKKAAAIISFISILIAGVSLIYMLFSIDPSSSFIDMLSGFAPGLGSIIFFIIFIYTLFKEGIYPLKEKISAFLNFDQAGVLIK